VQLGGNFVLLTPLAVLLPLLWTRFRSLKNIAITTVIMSLAIEVGQLALSKLFSFVYWTFDVDDLLLNITGAILMSLVVLLTLKININKTTSNTKPTPDSKLKR
jgi:glycopeptide antibiotics resistance protein